MPVLNVLTVRLTSYWSPQSLHLHIKCCVVKYEKKCFTDEGRFIFLKKISHQFLLSLNGLKKIRIKCHKIQLKIGSIKISFFVKVSAGEFLWVRGGQKSRAHFIVDNAVRQISWHQEDSEREALHVLVRYISVFFFILTGSCIISRT